LGTTAPAYFERKFKKKHWCDGCGVASFEIRGAPAGTYDFTFHILDVKRGSDNKSILDTIQLSPETAILEKQLQVTN